MNRLIKIMFTSLMIIIFVSITSYLIVMKIQGDPINDLVKYSYETSEITTDLKDGSFVRIQFQIVTDGKKAKNELAKRDFQIKNILIKELALLGEEEFTTELDKLEDLIRKRLNELMIDGNVLDVYTTHKILQ